MGAYGSDATSTPCWINQEQCAFGVSTILQEEKKQEEEEGFKHTSWSSYLVSGTEHSHSPLSPLKPGSPASRSRLCIPPGLPNPPLRSYHTFLKVLLLTSIVLGTSGQFLTSKITTQCLYSLVDEMGSQGGDFYKILEVGNYIHWEER